MQFVSRSVITGFVNALAILIFGAQLPQLVDDMTHTDSDKQRECLGQGGANVAAARVGGMVVAR